MSKWQKPRKMETNIIEVANEAVGKRNVNIKKQKNLQQFTKSIQDLVREKRKYIENTKKGQKEVMTQSFQTYNN